MKWNCWNCLDRGLRKWSKNSREVGKLKWLFYIGSENTPVDNIPWEGPEDTSLIKVTRNVLLAC